MRICAFTLATLAAASVLTGSADAAPRKKHPPVTTASGTVIQPTRTIIHNPDGTTTVITVPRRSYLDTGTELSVGDRGFHDYVLTPGGDPGRPYWFMGPDVRGAGRSPLPGAFTLPGFDPYSAY